MSDETKPINRFDDSRGWPTALGLATENQLIKLGMLNVEQAKLLERATVEMRKQQDEISILRQRVVRLEVQTAALQIRLDKPMKIRRRK